MLVDVGMTVVKMSTSEKKTDCYVNAEIVTISKIL